MECCFKELKEPGYRLQWDITEKCNLNCIHCCAEKTNTIIGYEKETVNKVIEILAKNGVKKVSLSGGEPTLNKSYGYIIDLLNTNNIEVSMITNLFYSEEIVDSYIDKVRSITTSIDGTELVHNQIRQAHCYSITMNNIKHIVSKGKSIKVISTLQDSNIDCLERTIENIYNCGVLDIMLAKISSKGKAIENNICLTNSTDLVSQRIQALRNKFNIELPISKCCYLETQDLYHCKGGKKIFYLDSNLILFPCHLRIVHGISIFSDNAFERVIRDTRI